MDKNQIRIALAGIYSISPYTLEEVLARNYLIGERPDAILNIVDGANLEATDEYSSTSAIVDGYDDYTEENGLSPTSEYEYNVEDNVTLEIFTETATPKDYSDSLAVLAQYGEEPDPADYGIRVPGIPVLLGDALRVDSDNPVCPEWLSGLLLDGIIAGVGTVLEFVPQMLMDNR